jgi:hypothetical protein
VRQELFGGERGAGVIHSSDLADNNPVGRRSSPSKSPAQDASESSR